MSATSPTPIRLSMIPRPGYEEIPFTFPITPSPKTIVEFLTDCLSDYEDNSRGFLMVIEYDPEDLIIKGQNLSKSMEILAGQVNKLFMQRMYGQDSVERQNYDTIPQIKVKTRFTSEGDRITEQRLVFTIQTEYRHEPNFNEVVDGKYSNGTYFMPPHYKV